MLKHALVEQCLQFRQAHGPCIFTCDHLVVDIQEMCDLIDTLIG